MRKSNIDYIPLSQEEISGFEEIFSTFKNVVLAMIRNAVIALPSKEKSYPSVNEHLNVNKTDGYRYENTISIKDVFLSCMPKDRRKFLNLTISHFAFDKKHRITFFLKKKKYSNLNKKSKIFFKNDMKKLKNIINYINDDFNNNLIEANRNRLDVLNKISNAKQKIPQKARYIEQQIEK